MLIADMAFDVRWPRFASFAHDHGVQSSYSIPMIAGGEQFGVLNLYSMGRPFGATDADIGSLFARDATNAVRHAAAFRKTRELIDNLHAALESRSMIGAAAGIVMSRDHVSMAGAFEKQVGISQEKNMKLRDVAHRITEVFEMDARSNARSEP